MEYISHEDYKKMMENFSKGTPKQSLNEAVEEGNAFTAGLAKAKKGEEFKVGDKTFKDKTNYDAPVSEEWDSPYDGGADDLKAMAKDAEGGPKVLGHVKGDVYKIRTVQGDVVDLDFEGERGDEIDPPYTWGGSLYAEYEGYNYEIPASFITAGGGQYDIEPEMDELIVTPVKGGMQEYQFDQMYPDDPGPFEGKNVDAMIKEFLLKEDDVNWDRMDDEEAEENETDNGIEEGDDMEEGLNPAPLQATGPTIQTVEGKKNKFAHLSAEERDQLRQYVETIKTVKEQIKKMTEKSEMEEGGDMTNLVMKPTTMSEDGEVDAHEDIETKIDPKLHDTFHKVLDMVTKQLLNAGFEESQVQEFLKHEVSELPSFVTSQYESK